MTTTPLTYQLQVQNNSKVVFEQVQQDVKKTDSDIKKVNASLAGATKGFAVGIQNELKGVADGVKRNLDGIHKGFLGLIGDVLGGLGKMVLGFVKMQLTMAAVGLILANLGRITSWVGKLFGEEVGGKFRQFSDWISQAFTKVGASAEVGRQQLFKWVPALKAITEAMNAAKVGFKSGIDGILMVGESAKLLKSTNAEIKPLLSNIHSLFYMLGNLGRSAKISTAALTQISASLKNISSAIPGFTKLTGALNLGVDKLKAFWKESENARAAFMKFAGAAVQGIANLISFIVKFPVASAAIAAGVVTIITTFKDLRKTVDELDKKLDQSKIVGMNVATYMGWDAALRYAGSSMESLSSVISRFNEDAYKAATEGGNAATAFKNLGIEVLDAQGYLRGNKELFTETIQKLSAMEDKALRNGMALDIFGTRGKEIIPLLDEYNGGLDKVIASYERHDKSLQRAANASSNFNDQLQAMKDGWDIAKAEMYTRVIESLTIAFDLISNSSMGEVLKQAGKLVMWLGSALIDLGTIIAGVFSNAINGVIYAFSGLNKYIYDALYNTLAAINDTKLGDAIISDEMLERLRTRYLQASDETKAFRDDIIGTSEDIAKAFSHLLGLGSDPAAPSADNKQKPPDNTKPAKGAGASYGDTFVDYSSMLNDYRTYNDQRIQVLNQYAALAIGNQSEWYRRELDTLKVANAEKMTEILKLQTFGILTEDEANQYRLQQAIYYENEQRKISEQATEEYLERIRKQQAETLKVTQDTANGVADALQPMHDGFSAIVELARLSADANEEYLDSVSAVLDGLSTMMESLTESFSNITTTFSDVTATVQERFQSVASAISAIGSSINSIISQVVANQNAAAMAALDSWYEEEKEALNSSVMGHRKRAKELEKLEAEKAKKEAKLKKEAFEKQQAAAIVQAIISGAVAIVQSYAQLGPIAGSVMAAVIAGLTIAQIAIIASQESGYATGGIVPGTSYSGDKVPARVNSGEMILNKQQQSELFAMANGKSRASAAQPVTISTGDVIIQGSVTNEQLDRLGELKIAEREELRQMIRDLTYEYGSLEAAIG